MSRRVLSPSVDLPKLTPCAARLLELLVARLPEVRETGTLRLGFAKEGSKSELDYYAPSPSEELQLWLETTPEAVELRLSEKNKSGFASAIFFMHPLNFHRTCEAAVDFVDKIAQGQIIVARTKKRVFPFVGHKRLRFFEVGEIVGEKAADIERVFAWKRLNLSQQIDTLIKNKS